EMVELIDITYGSHDCVTSVVEAADECAPQVDESTLNNVVAILELGDKTQCTESIEHSAYSLNLTVTNNRVIANPMEPRSSIGQFDNKTGRWTLHCGNQGPHHSRRMLATALGCDEEQLRIRVHRIGGGFGAKLTPYPEDALVLYAARKFNRTVRWRCDRSEAFLADFHARDHVADINIGFDHNYRITAVVIENLANLGAYPSPFGIPIATTTGNRIVNGVYHIPELALSVKTVLTHTAPTAPYRGAGRPESIHRLEVALDAAAKQFNIDPAELRRRNLISPEHIPYKAHSGLTYDSGNFLNVLERALKLADWTGFPERKARSAEQNMVRGRGLACHIDSTSGLQPVETVTACIDATGRCTFYSGTQEMGQGLSHTYAGMVAAILELPLENIAIVQGDTDAVKSGIGSYGSRSLMIGGAAVVQAANVLVEKLRAMGANLLETEADNVHYTRGTVSTNDGDRQVTVGEISAAQPNGKIEVEATAEAPFSFPNGCYVCEVDIDPETGAIRVDKFVGVDDLGNVINETLVHGQTHGGLAQGVGQALFEQIIYSDAGELLTGSTLDYPLPRADDLPAFNITIDESQPATTNYLGIKGAGECGAVGGPAAVMSAVIDALPSSAVASLQMPLTTEKIWRALKS
ncbi:MAG: xanthine dehydrogenase family protein molybdopterin-binding subunit, partial [Gammaproteobacteria bacterium]